VKITVLTLFPEFFTTILSSSILGRAQKKGLVEYELINLRDFGAGRHKTVDDRPYGGGTGMVLKADILTKAWQATIGVKEETCTILMSASGSLFNDSKARQLSRIKQLIIICGHYEGIDQRFIDKYVDEEISIGDFVLTGGEIPALAIIDAVTRQIPSVLKDQATAEESFAQGLLEYPQYTRPEIFEDIKVPEVLLSGNHLEIALWRKRQSLEKTSQKRPDLLKKISQKD